MLIPESLQSQEIVSIDPLMNVQEAATLMLSQNIGALAVVEEKRLVGLLTERDLMNKIVAKAKPADETFVQEIMTTELLSATTKTTLAEALMLMSQNHFRHLPLLDETGHPICIFSFRDLYEYRLKQLEHENQALFTLARLGISPTTHDR